MGNIGDPQMSKPTATDAAERTRAPLSADLSDGERRLIAQAAALRPHEGLRIVEAMCALGQVAKLMARS